MDPIEIIGGLKVEPEFIKLEKKDNEAKVVEVGDQDVANEEIDEKERKIKDSKDELFIIMRSNFDKELEKNHLVNSTQKNQQSSVKRVPATKNTNTKRNKRTTPTKILITNTTKTKTNKKTKEKFIPNKNLIGTTTSIRTDKESMINNIPILSPINTKMEEETMPKKIAMSSNRNTDMEKMPDKISILTNIKIDKSNMPNETSVLSRLDGKPEYSDEGEEKYKCNYCGDVIDGKREIKLHILKIHKNVKLYQCPKCPYQAPYTLGSHMLYMHTDRKDINFVSCYICGHKSKTKHGLRNHITSHTDKTEMLGQLVKCSQCPKMFKKKNLRGHVRSIHDKAEIELLKCKLCPYKCKWKKDLERHEAMHFTETGEVKTVKCSQCSFRAVYKPRLTAHIKRRHGSLDYQCHVCSYQGRTDTLLKLHLIGHKEKKDEQEWKFRCDRCDYKSYRAYNLQIHKLNHLKPEEIKYFFCHHCDFKANRKDNLKTHIFIHFKKEEVTLACYICDFTTKKRDKLVCHIENHSKKLKEPKKKEASSEFETEKRDRPKIEIENHSKELNEENNNEDKNTKNDMITDE